MLKRIWKCVKNEVKGTDKLLRTVDGVRENLGDSEEIIE
jgi:hypothetical protein